MPDATVKRTLVKSPPELWAEISDADALARHLGRFGEIRITRTDPETTVAWEGDRARGTVEIEGSGWGTKVTLTAEAVQAAAPVEAPAALEAEVEKPPPFIAPEPPEAAAPEPPIADSSPPEEARPVQAPKKPGFWARLFGRKPTAAEQAPAPGSQATDPEPDPEPVQAPVIPLTPAPEPAPEPAPVEQPPAAVEPPAAVAVAPEPTADPVPALDAARTEDILNSVLDDLGAAHHRPFSR